MLIIENEIKEKLTDGLLNHSDEWQWFISYVESKVDSFSFASFDSFQTVIGSLNLVYSRFIDIIKLSNIKHLEFQQPFVSDVWKLANYYLGLESLSNTKNNLITTSGRFYFLCIWTTKILNFDNNKDYLLNIQPLIYRNVYQIYSMHNSELEWRQILEYGKSIPMNGIEEPINCLEDNIFENNIRSNLNFLGNLYEHVYTINLLNSKLIKSECKTWQEVCLIDMFKISLHHFELVPLYSVGEEMVPNYQNWTEDIINKLISYFDNPISDFLIYTIAFFLHDKLPIESVVAKHCELLVEHIKANDLNSVIDSTSYLFVSKLLQSNAISQKQKRDYFIEFFKIIHAVSEPEVILKLKNDNFPITKDQNRVLFEYTSTKYKEIESVTNICQLMDLVNNPAVIKYIDNEYLLKTNNLFYKFIVNVDNLNIPAYFIEFMHFLSEIKRNSKIDKISIDKLMIQLQKSWTCQYYSKSVSKMQKISYSGSVNKDALNNLNEIFLSNPVILADSCMPVDESKIFKIIKNITDHPLLYQITNLNISPYFPTFRKFVTKNHDIDQLFNEYLAEVYKKYEIKFLNHVEMNKLLSAVYENYAISTRITVAAFDKVNGLYASIRKFVSKELLPFNSMNDLNLSYVTQLFPILEIKIEELAILFGYFPFRINDSHFMEHKSANTLISSMIKYVYDRQNSFKNIPDLLFVYNTMYNVNSFNIRNDCIHGRNYLDGYELRFAFIVTLFSLYIIIFRIETINNSVSDIKDVLDC